jgi:hypothetical protein
MDEGASVAVVASPVAEVAANVSLAAAAATPAASGPAFMLAGNAAFGRRLSARGPLASCAGLGAGNRAISRLAAGHVFTPGLVARPVAAAPAGLMVAPEASGAPRLSVASTNALMRDARDLIPDVLLESIRGVVAVIPGYAQVALVMGKDPITGKPVAGGENELVEELLTFGPFGPAVSAVLQAIEVAGDVVTFLTNGLREHNLTLARIEGDLAKVWDEVSIAKGIDENAKIIERHVSAFASDLKAFIEEVADHIIQMVRAVIAKFVEPLLETPAVKPIWDLARKVLHYDPLRGVPVQAPTVEILGDFLRLIGKEDLLAQMQERGTLQKTADWLDAQFATFASISADVGKLFHDAWEAISPSNLPTLLDTLPGLVSRAVGLLGRISSFATGIPLKILELIKQSLLGWLSEHAHQIPGFHLLTVILARNPLTGEVVPRTPENLIKGFVTLLPGGEGMYQHLAESGVIADAAGQIESAIGRLGISWGMISDTFHRIWDSLHLEDLLAPLAAFERVVGTFKEPITRIFEFIEDVLKVVVTLILKLMDFPSDLLASIIGHAMAAIDRIKQDPVAFFKNMLAALKAGIAGFFDGILGFLAQGLSSWLFHSLGKAGITVPSDLSLGSILTMVMQILGLSVEHLWKKLGEHIGEDKVKKMRTALDKLGQAWAFIKDVTEGGLGALWKHLTEQLGNLWDTVLGMAQDWVMSEIVEKVAQKLLSMLDPTGVMAVVNSFIAFFKAIQSAIEYMRDILKVVDDYVTTFAEVAAGNIGPGAQKIIQGLANAIPIAIGFLANQVGLGDVSEKVVEIIGGLREMVDKALDWLIEKAIQLGKAALDALGFGDEHSEKPAAAKPKDEDLHVDESFDADGESHELKTVDEAGELFVFSTPPGKRVRDVDKSLVELYDDYLEARKAYRAGVDASYQEGADKGSSPGKTKLTNAVKAIVAKLKELDISDDPGMSAPNIGNIARHGAQPVRLRNGPRLWWLESEHVIPFASSAQIWEQLWLPKVVRTEAKQQDKLQTTIMLYEGAAEAKTSETSPIKLPVEVPADLTRIDQEKAREVQARTSDIGDAQANLEPGKSREAQLKGWEKWANDILAAAKAELPRLAMESAARTLVAVKAEASAHTNGHKKTNAERRGEPADGLPTIDKIADAAKQQSQDLAEMIDAAWKPEEVAAGQLEL